MKKIIGLMGLFIVLCVGVSFAYPSNYCIMLSSGLWCTNNTMTLGDVYNKSQVDALINNISLTPGPQGPQGIPGVNGTDGIDGINGSDGSDGTNGIDGANLTMINVTNNLNGTYTWFFSDGTNFTTDNLTGPRGLPGIDGVNGTSFNVSGIYLYNISNTIYFNDTPLQNFNDTTFIINNYYNKTIIDQMFSVFTLENNSIWGTIDLKLNITDQRYNDTAYINNKFGTLTDNKWCIGDGGKVVCEQTTPATVSSVSLVSNNLASNITSLNNSINSVNTTAINALPKSGGVMTGNISTNSQVVYSINGTVVTYANGCSQVANSSGVYFVC